MTWLIATTATLTVAVSSFAFAQSAPAPHKLEIVGHRGAPYEMPENTLLSFNTAWKQDADACENDIHLTKDGQVVVMHDADVYRTTGGKDGGTHLLIKNATADQLRALDVGSWKSPEFKGEKIPFLSECLATIPDGKRFFIEIKSGTDVVPAAVQIIQNSGKTPAQVALISFHIDALKQAKQLLPDHQCYLLAGAQRDKSHNVIGWHMLESGKAHNVRTLEDVIRIAKDIHADGVDLDSNGPLTDHPGDLIHQAGLAFYAWTVDDPEVARKLIRQGVDGITTNRQQWLKQQLRAQ